MSENLKLLFPRDYPTAKENFIAAAKGARAELLSYKISDTLTPNNTDLTVDIAWLGSRDAGKIMVVSSGVHGIEGPVGSGIQTEWLKNANELTVKDKNIAVVMIHTVNPFGFAYVSRFNEINIDVNRNFVTFPVAPNQAHSYHIFADKLSPSGAMKLDGFGTRTGIITTLLKTTGRKAIAHGSLDFSRLYQLTLREIQDALSTGQYWYSDGLFYGGQAKSQSRLILEDFISKQLQQAKTIMHVDMHTGLGEFGNVQIMAEFKKDSVEHKLIRKMWPQENIGVMDQANNDTVSSTLTGTVMHAWNLLPHAKIVPVFAEFGTRDRKLVLRALCFNNAVRHRPNDFSVKDKERAREMLIDVFAPKDPAWDAAVLKRGLRIVNRAYAALAQNEAG